MNVENLQNLALQNLKGTEFDMKWGNLCFTVSTKLYLLISIDSVPIGAAFKIEPIDFADLVQHEAFSQAPYFAKNHWIRIDNINKMTESEWLLRMQNSYNLVFAKLSTKAKNIINNLS